MVVLTLVAQKNGETIFLDQAIPEVHFMKLISCSLYNSWEKVGALSINEDGKEKLSEVSPGHYTLEAVAETIKRFSDKIRVDVYSPLGPIIITELTKQPLLIDRDLRKLLDNNLRDLRKKMAYFIHCDLIDRNYNFFNNKKSDLLAKIDVKGRPYEKIRYDASPQQPIRDCSTSSHVNSITISVRVQDGELFDFKGMPLEFELELNFYNMSSNVLPSAPHDESNLYPQLSPHDFRMQKANEVSAALNAEVVHYRGVAKKYKRAKKTTNWAAAGSGLVSTACSSASFGSALTVVGIPAAIPLGGLGGLFALASSGLIIASKKLDSKIKKHQEIVTLAIAKRDTVCRFHSKALSDNKISDGEFQLIMAEFHQYTVLKEAVRAKLTRKPSQPDITRELVECMASSTQ